MNTSFPSRLRHVTRCGLVLAAALSFAPSAKAEVTCHKEEAPRLFVDLFSSTRIYPNADAALIGFEIGVIGRPTDKCLHLAGEGFTRFGSRSSVSGELKMRTAGSAVGALWGNGDQERCSTWAGLGWALVTTS
ncbi:MAG: hypothetical protein JRE19_19940 [Deltaproteobacteria bacterium]|nr:hypothetical protein [Deltaproteobacteria bacterium]